MTVKASTASSNLDERAVAYPPLIAPPISGCRQQAPVAVALKILAILTSSKTRLCLFFHKLHSPVQQMVLVLK